MLAQCLAGTSSTNSDQLVGSCFLVWLWKQLQMVRLSYLFLCVVWGIANECETSNNINCCQSFATSYILEGDKFLTILQMKQHQSDCQENKSGKITVDADVLCTQKSCNINLAHFKYTHWQLHWDQEGQLPRSHAPTISSEKPCARGVNTHYKIIILCTCTSLSSATSLLYTQTKLIVYHSHVLIQDPANGSSVHAARAGITALV